MVSNDIIAVVGMRDHGKTTWVRKHVEQEGNLIVVDSLGDHTLGKKGRPPWLGAPDHRDNLEAVLEEIELGAAKGEFQIGVPLPPDEEEQKIWFDFLCKEAYQTAEYHGGATLVVEEMGLFTEPTYTPTGLNLIVQYGAHAGVNLVWTSRNVGEVSRRLTSETDLYILFAHHEPRWLDALDERLSEEVAERVRLLPPGVCLWVNRKGEIEQEEKLW